MSPLQRLLDRLTIHPYIRWGIFVSLYTLFLGRIITTWNTYPAILYLNSTNLLFSFIGFITPAVDMESAHAVDILPTKDNDRPFPRALAEFKAWKTVTQVTIVCLCATFIPGIEYIPCDFPLLVVYFLSMLIYLVVTRVRVRCFWFL